MNKNQKFLEDLNNFCMEHDYYIADDYTIKQSFDPIFKNRNERFPVGHTEHTIIKLEIKSLNDMPVFFEDKNEV